MQKPAMILFDYAHTLAWEPAPDFLRGEQAVFRHVQSNPGSVTPEEAARFADLLALCDADTAEDVRARVEAVEFPAKAALTDVLQDVSE